MGGVAWEGEGGWRDAVEGGGGRRRKKRFGGGDVAREVTGAVGGDRGPGDVGG